MTQNELCNQYFEWMYHQIVNYDDLTKKTYRKLCAYLDDVDFFYLIDNDGNREQDGIDLRYRFGYENEYEESMISRYLDRRPCSVFEMMVALSIRCEEHILYDPDVGNQTGFIFWEMIDSLGLDRMDDLRFDEDYTNSIIIRFLNRKYERNGKGGLFTIKRPDLDLRTVEIWYQMSWYLNEVT